MEHIAGLVVGLVVAAVTISAVLLLCGTREETQDDTGTPVGPSMAHRRGAPKGKAEIDPILQPDWAAKHAQQEALQKQQLVVKAGRTAKANGTAGGDDHVQLVLRQPSTMADKYALPSHLTKQLGRGAGTQPNGPPAQRINSGNGPVPVQHAQTFRNRAPPDGGGPLGTPLSAQMKQDDNSLRTPHSFTPPLNPPERVYHPPTKATPPSSRLTSPVNHGSIHISTASGGEAAGVDADLANRLVYNGSNDHNTYHGGKPSSPPGSVRGPPLRPTSGAPAADFAPALPASPPTESHPHHMQPQPQRSQRMPPVVSAAAWANGGEVPVISKEIEELGSMDDGGSGGGGAGAGAATGVEGGGRGGGGVSIGGGYGGGGPSPFFSNSAMASLSRRVMPPSHVGAAEGAPSFKSAATAPPATGDVPPARILGGVQLRPASDVVEKLVRGVDWSVAGPGEGGGGPVGRSVGGGMGAGRTEGRALATLQERSSGVEPVDDEGAVCRAVSSREALMRGMASHAGPSVRRGPLMGTRSGNMLLGSAHANAARWSANNNNSNNNNLSAAGASAPVSVSPGLGLFPAMHLRMGLPSHASAESLADTAGAPHEPISLPGSAEAASPAGEVQLGGRYSYTRNTSSPPQAQRQRGLSFGTEVTAAAAARAPGQGDGTHMARAPPATWSGMVATQGTDLEAGPAAAAITGGGVEGATSAAPPPGSRAARAQALLARNRNNLSRLGTNAAAGAVLEVGP
ncbi:hypothetical protein Agub_g15505 [Astrephomene gubernaculifera]|uniref:Uncharacterized protein n=1 Tax=Astrephomene gubernaculifera TaxID=47775 RepID=A0AAD3E3C5_9CHLO|nr:hypothetical protein Agub_g15505 [Astrephomene gubernaculifera]